MRASDLPLIYNAVQILEHNLKERAQKTALYSNERNLTFQECSDEVNRVGNALQKLGVHFGESVAILNHDNAEWAIAYFAALKIGAVAVGMNTLLKPHEHAYILNDSRARVLLVHASMLSAIESVREQLLFLKHIVVIGGDSSAPLRSARNDTVHYADWIANESTELETAPTHRDDFCALNYSSGTTGEPKGILHAHKDLPLTSQLWAVNVLRMRESDRTFATAKLFFTFGTGGNLVFPWYVGASCVLMAAPPRIATNVLETIQKFKPTIHFNAPTGYAAILGMEDFAQQYDLSSLRLCVSAGESLPAPVWEQWKEKTGVDIIDGIGCTEIWHIFISNSPDDIRPGSSGKPVPGMQVRIVDENLQDVPQGAVGNLLVKSETTALLYLHQAEKSRRTFLGEWLVTGDKYHVDADGYYWHAGRSDDMLKVGGIFVSPVEVESTLMSHPAVLECAVVGVPDSASLIKPKAFIVLKQGYNADDALQREMIAYCKEKMAEYKRPRWIEFVNELPKTATGKIQRFKLRG
ncbi:MAG: benzoate-CoA ligase family protein [Chloroflexota bacterium]|nr:MAG: benzoate-CoA ligase family protein [Chloroflexota bacterium]